MKSKGGRLAKFDLTRMVRFMNCNDKFGLALPSLRDPRPCRPICFKEGASLSAEVEH